MIKIGTPFFSNITIYQVIEPERLTTFKRDVVYEFKFQKLGKSCPTMLLMLKNVNDLKKTRMLWLNRASLEFDLNCITN
ncbi:hypothetical protein BpHYR1_021100 [Brachionus plicatilis]|uniref:Uncharacterized protein n=1 Tax=Brachionus plicatilis TaxID=10195 RepID=A0A3M7PEY2_BRAPC|nr:hypothetical protein BpHYR1_021100 [Brachionus plicatilis]